jgi:hypothetical protein
LLILSESVSLSVSLSVSVSPADESSVLLGEQAVPRASAAATMRG